MLSILCLYLDVLTWNIVCRFYRGIIESNWLLLNYYNNVDLVFEAIYKRYDPLGVICSVSLAILETISPWIDSILICW